MGWFEEQIKLRQERDDLLLDDSYLKIASAVTGHHAGSILLDQHIQVKDALDEVLKYYGLKGGAIPDSIKDLDAQLEYALRPHGIMRRVIRLDKGWSHDASGVMLSTMKESGVPVCFLPGKLSGYTFLDSSTGKREKVTDENEELFSKEAYVFYKPFPLRKLATKDIVRYAFSMLSARDIVWYLCLLFMATLTGMLMPQLSKMLFSDVIVSGSVSALMAMAVFMVCVSASSMLINAANALVSVRIERRLSMSIESATMMRLLSLPADFFKKFSAGELANRSEYMNLLCRMTVTQILSVGISSLFALFYLIQVYAFAPLLAAPALCITFSNLLITLISILWQSGISRTRMELASKESGVSYSLIAGIQKIKLSGAEKRAFAKWGEHYARVAEKTYSLPILLKVAPVLANAVTLFGTVWLYAKALECGISTANYYAFNAAYGMVSGALLMLSTLAASISEIGPALSMIRPIMETEPETTSKRQVLTRISGSVEMNNVTFRYGEGMPNIIDNLSLKIRPGQYVAIVGATGCGKSTLMRLMLGFEEPQKGAVYYDEKNLANIDLKSLRQKIGVVMQDGKLFQGDIYSNIVICAPELSLDAAWEAAEMAGIADDIRQMPMGMFTLISEGQGGISGGQRQRLMIARAIAPKPKILMFDEATSALDNLTQKKVTESLDKLKCTRIVIAHRLSTIKSCDRIIVLDKGKIVEDGSFNELIEKDGQFAELVARQRLDETDYVGMTTMF